MMKLPRILQLLCLMAQNEEQSTQTFTVTLQLMTAFNIYPFLYCIQRGMQIYACNRKWVWFFQLSVIVALFERQIIKLEFLSIGLSFSAFSWNLRISLLYAVVCYNGDGCYIRPLTSFTRISYQQSSWYNFLDLNIIVSDEVTSVLSRSLFDLSFRFKKVKQ